jgi:hypothetical protein
MKWCTITAGAGAFCVKDDNFMCAIPAAGALTAAPAHQAQASLTLQPCPSKYLQLTPKP